MDLSLVIPLLNEEDSLKELCERLTAVLSSTRLSYEILFIDDGSVDRSSEVIKGLIRTYSQASLISLKRNYGKSNALMVGFSKAQGERVITMDADLQDRPENIPALLEKSEYDLVSGLRESRKDSVLKKLLSKIFNRLINFIFNVDCKDMNCGFKVYKKELYKSLNLYGDLHRMTLVLAEMEGCSWIEVPIEHDPRRHGVSKYPMFRARGMWDIFSVRIMGSLQTRPFHFFAPYSVLLMILSFLLMLLMAFGVVESSFAETILIIISVLGVYLFVVGLQFETQLNQYNKGFPVDKTIKEVVDHAVEYNF
jgi:glycosyltransferase involved in cell wall biosynthesis